MTTYISREEALKILNRHFSAIRPYFIEEIIALPSLQDQVVELIEKKFKKYVSHAKEKGYTAISIPLFESLGEELIEEIKTIK